MKFIATQKNIRQTPRKIRLVANQVKDLSLEQALRQLAVIQRRSTLVLLKTFKQAMANAKNNYGVAISDLEIAEVTVMVGPSYKRFNAVSRGRAHAILKRTSHLRVVLQTKSDVAVDPKAAVKSVSTKTEVAAKTEDKKAKAPAKAVSTSVKPVKQSRAVKANAAPKNVIRKSTTSK